MEPDFERFRTAVLCQGEPDCVPFVDAEVYVGHKARVIGHVVRGLADEIEFARRIGYDFVPLKAGLHLTPTVRNALKQTNHTVEDGSDMRFQDLPGERRWVTADTGVIVTEADFEAFDWPDPDQFDYSAFAEADEVLPSNMKAVCIIGKVFNLVWWLMGFENFCIALVDNPSLVERMFQRVGSIQYRVLERTLEYQCVGAYWHSDDVAFGTGLMVSPQTLRRYAIPWFRSMVALAHSRDVVTICHSDGRLDEIIDEIIDIGFDGLHPIEPQAMDIVELSERVKGKLCLLGNIDLGYTLTRGTPEEVEEEVRIRIRHLAPGGGYCLGSSNSVPEYVPFENYIAMRNAWLKYGKYPIQVG